MSGFECNTTALGGLDEDQRNFKRFHLSYRQANTPQRAVSVVKTNIAIQKGTDRWAAGQTDRRKIRDE